MHPRQAPVSPSGDCLEYDDEMGQAQSACGESPIHQPVTAIKTKSIVNLRANTEVEIAPLCVNVSEDSGESNLLQECESFSGHSTSSPMKEKCHSKSLAQQDLIALEKFWHIFRDNDTNTISESEERIDKFDPEVMIQEIKDLRETGVDHRTSASILHGISSSAIPLREDPSPKSEITLSSSEYFEEVIEEDDFVEEIIEESVKDSITSDGMESPDCNSSCDHLKVMVDVSFIENDSSSADWYSLTADDDSCNSSITWDDQETIHEEVMVEGFEKEPCDIAKRSAY